MIQEFAHSLTKKEKTYLWDHVHRYAGVEGISAEEHQSCNTKAALDFNSDGSSSTCSTSWTETTNWRRRFSLKRSKCTRTKAVTRLSFGFDPKNLKSIRTRLNALGIDTTTMTHQQLRNNARIIKDLEDESFG